VLFGPEFAAEYQQFAREMRALEPHVVVSGVHPAAARSSSAPRHDPAEPVRPAGQTHSNLARR
jgi:hypothetical protein